MAKPFKVSRDARGYWRRQNLGWTFAVVDGQDVYRPKTWVLGTHYAEACERASVLERLWSEVESEWAKSSLPPDQRSERPVWHGVWLFVASAVARGEREIDLSPLMADATPSEAYMAVLGMADRLPYVRLAVPPKPAVDDAEGLVADFEAIEDEAERRHTTARRLRREVEAELTGRVTPKGETLHKALDAFAGFLGERYSVDGVLTPTGKNRTKQVALLKSHHADAELAELTAGKMEQMEQYWANRPRSNRKGGGIVAVETARSMLKILRWFWRFLNRSDFHWSRPATYEPDRRRIRLTAEDRERIMNGPDVWPEVWHLTQLWQHAEPLDRLCMLLALNCGFGNMECGTLTFGELDLERGRVRRLRQKTNVGGEWSLWPETVAALRWYVESVRPQCDCGYVLVTKVGTPIVQATKSGNPGRWLPNNWQNVLRRVRRSFDKFPCHSFGTLRNTAATFVRAFAGNDIAELFLGHKTPGQLGAYGRNPYALVAEATTAYRHELRSMLDSVADPFPAWFRHQGMTAERLREIYALRDAGHTYQRIAELTGLNYDKVRNELRKRKAAHDE